jgi:hypothetical protein
MLRFLSERRAWVVAACVASMLVVGLWIWAASRATARASDLLGDRLGVEANVERARLAFGGIELVGVQIRGRHGGFVARLDQVDARLSPLGALFEGFGSVRRVSAQGVEVTIDLREPGLSTSLAEVKQTLTGRSTVARSAGQARRAGGRGRTFEVDDLTFRVIDAQGTLLSIEGASLQKQPNELRASATRTIVGAESAEHANLGPSTIALVRSNGAWAVRELSIEGAGVRSVHDGDPRERALALRIRDGLALLRPSEPDPTDEQPASGDSPPVPARLFARLSPDANISVSGVQIESRASAERIQRIEDLHIAVNGGDNGWYRVRVAGETSDEGALNVDLSIMPANARAEGRVELQRMSLALIAPFVPDLPLYHADAGTLTANLDLIASSSDRIGIEGRVRLRELALNTDRIAPEPIENIGIELAGKGVWYPDERRLHIENGRVSMGKAHVSIDGELERTSEHYRVELTAKLPPTDCNDVVGAIPEQVLAPLAGFQWSGTWSGLARISLDSRDLEATELSIRVRNLCHFERVPNWVRVERFRQPFQHRAIEPDESVFQMQTGPGTLNWVAFADISPFVVPAVISHEDGAFYDHGGFAPWAIRDALVRNLREGRYVVGASTISMQLAKNLYLHREKTIARKVQEVILTWWLENALTKDEILELYLNVIEYGPGVYGLRQAAAYYFGRGPNDLSPAESAFLACVLPSPERYHLSYERGALTRSMKGNMRRLLEHTAKRERIGPEALAYGLAELEDFHFHREADPPPPPRVLPPLGTPDTSEAAALDPFEALFVVPEP